MKIQPQPSLCNRYADAVDDDGDDDDGADFPRTTMVAFMHDVPHSCYGCITYNDTAPVR